MSWVKPKTNGTGKGSQRVNHGQTHRPIEEIVAAQRAAFEAEKKQLPTLRRRLNRLESEAKKLTKRRQIHQRRDAEAEAEKLRAHIMDLETGASRKIYDARVQPYLDAMTRAANAPPPTVRRPSPAEGKGEDRKRKEPPTSSTGTMNRPRQRARRKAPTITREMRIMSDDRAVASTTAIHDEFLSNLSDQATGAPSAIYVVSGNSCDQCGEGTLKRSSTESTIICDSCGHSKSFIESTSSTLGYSEDTSSDYASFSYKRANHFTEWLNSTQAKETTEVPTEVIEGVMQIFYEQRLKITDITTEKVRAALKAKRQRRYYENVQLIHSLITGQQPMRFTPEQEARLRAMFSQIQDPFEKNCPSTRKNFLSYSYVLYKFVELLALDYFKSSFSLLKGRDKLYRQDQIWQKICADLDWEFIPSI